jgi:putative FmdB family regulatory protein
MPIFEYRCQQCGTVFERILRRPAEMEMCPRCGGKAIMTISMPAPATSSTMSSGCGSGGFS